MPTPDILEGAEATTKLGERSSGLEQGVTPAGLEFLKLWAFRILFGLLLLMVWQLAAGRLIDEFWISTPLSIVARLSDWIRTGLLLHHTMVTLQEALGGLLIGGVAGIVLGFSLGQNDFLARIMDPYITAVYSLPKVALAPLFILWFGIGITAKVVYSAVVVFFLVFFNTFAGVRDVDKDLIDVIRIMGGGRWHLLVKIILPTALTWIFLGLKVAIPYALIGAVVAEIVASNRGLGYLIEYSAGQFDTTGVFAALFVLMVISTILNEALARAEAFFMRWKIAGKEA